MFRSVDLPHPDGPTKHTNWPSSIDKFTLFTAKTLFFHLYHYSVKMILLYFSISNLLN